MAWSDLGVNTGYCYFQNFVAYSGGLAWINDSHEVLHCETDGSGLTRLDSFTSGNLWFPYLVNFKGYLYLAFWDSTTTGTCVYKYSGVGTTWNEVLRVDGLNLPRISLACTSQYMLATISADFGGDSWDVRKTTDGSNWTNISKPSSDDWDTYGAVASDFDNYFYIILGNLSNGNLYAGYLLETESTINQGVDLTQLGYTDSPQTRGNVASTYFVESSAPYNVYRSVDRGNNRTLCFEDFYNFGACGVDGVDFVFGRENNSPWHYYLYCYIYEDPVDSWRALEDSNSIVSASGIPGGVARVNNTLYVAVGDKIYSSSAIIDWPSITPPEPTTNHQMLQCIATPFLGGEYFWTTWINDTVAELQKRSLVDGSIVQTKNLGTLSVQDVISGSYAVYVNAYDDETLYVYGRFNTPEGMENGTYHIIMTENGITGTWQVIENDWGEDVCGALEFTKSERVLAVRNGTTINLYAGNVGGSVLTQYSTIPLSGVVGVGGLCLDSNNNLFAASNISGQKIVVRSSPPYTGWVDITKNLQTGVNRLISLK